MYRKTLQIGLVCLFCFGINLGCTKSESDEVTPPQASGPDEKLVSYKVTGMTCENCEQHISGKLAKLPNVKEARASRKKEVVWLVVTGDAPTKDTVSEAVAAVAKEQGGKYKVVDNEQG